jgi:hypothetical protein
MTKIGIIGKAGYAVFRTLEPHGGYSYWIDDVGGGRCMFDEGLDDWDLLDELRRLLTR